MDLMFSVFELYGNDVEKRTAFGAPDNWEVDGILKWPITKNINLFRKNKVPPEDDWEWTRDYKVLARHIPNLKACLAKERELEFYSDSESAEKAKKKKALKRLHPVNASSKSAQFNLSSEFEAKTVQKKKCAPGLNSVGTPGLNSLGASKSTASPAAIIHSIEIIKVPSDANQTTETHTRFVGTDSMIPNFDEIDISNLPIVLEESTDEYIPFTLNGSTENEALQSQLTESSELTESSDANGSMMMFMKKAFQALSDSICCRMDALDKKIDRLDIKVDRLATKQDALESKIVSSEQKIDSELKLMAGVHVKLDTLPTPNTPGKKKSTSNVNIPLPIPSTSPEDVQKILLAVKNDANIAEDLETRLVSFGGDTARKCTYAILKHLFDDEVCVKYTWQGTFDKSPFEKLTQIHELIKKCVRVHFPPYTDDQYKKDVQEHLKHALTRESRKYF